MKLIPLTEVGHVLHAGISLPWVVRDSKGIMLLARGYLLPDQRSVNAILSRGMYVDWEDVENTERSTHRQPVAQEESMLDHWHRLQINLALMLRSSTEQYFLQKVGEAIAPIAALADSNVDLLIFLILRHDHVRLMKYGVVHALHCASLCSLLSRRLGWNESKRHSLIGAALTMNISMIELQGQLAQREGRPTAVERQAIDDHPRASAEILRTAGLDDEQWLTTVEQHHEVPTGKGYPNKLNDPTEMSQLLRLVDCFSAKHSPRAGRKPQPAQQAARELFTQNGGHPLAALLIKELGIYPPGVFVKLANGETAIVTQRGATANAPFVAAVMNRSGDPLTIPLLRDTALPLFAIVSVIAENDIKIQVSANALYDRAKP